MTAILWIIILVLDGAEEAALFAHGNTKHPEGYNVHRYVVPIRVVWVTILSFSEFLFGQPYPLSVVWSCIELLGLWRMLPMWHDGAYYTFRKLIEPNGPITGKYNFFSQSQTTTATISFSFPYRFSFFVLGCVLYYLQYSYATN